MTRTAVLREVKGPIAVERLELQLPKAGEVLVKVHAAGVCKSDWQVCTGATPHVLPVALGHEGAGTVVKVGTEVNHLQTGDRVVLNWAPACDICFYCQRGRPSLCTSTKETVWAGVMIDGTPRLSGRDGPVYQYCALGCFSEYAVVAASACVPLRSEVSMSVGALIGCCVTTGIGAVLNTADVPAGSSVAVFGVGGVGLAAVMGARLARAALIIAIDAVADREPIAMHLGADHFVLACGDPLSAIREQTDGRGADYVIDATGLTQVQEQCLDAVRPGGTVVLAGLAPVGSATNLSGALITREEITIKGCYYGTSQPKRDFSRYAEYYLEGKLDLDSLITRAYTLSNIAEAYRDLQEGRLARGVVIMDS